jgi:hypothetical protein
MVEVMLTFLGLLLNNEGKEECFRAEVVAGVMEEGSYKYKLRPQTNCSKRDGSIVSISSLF